MSVRPMFPMPHWWPRLAVLAFVAMVSIFPLLPGAAQAAALRIEIGLATQEMQVSLYGLTQQIWPVSTGRPGYRTPRGSFSPIRLAAKWYSRKYDNAPMPHSIFFHGGYAIHGTSEIRNLGRPASHGCVRLHPDNARTLFNLVRRYGVANTLITIRP